MDGMEMRALSAETESEVLADLSESILVARLEDWIEKNVD